MKPIIELKKLLQKGFHNLETNLSKRPHQFFCLRLREAVEDRGQANGPDHVPEEHRQPDESGHHPW